MRSEERTLRSDTMMPGWRLSLLLAAVTLHGCLSAEPQDEKSRRDVVHLYNQREGVTYLYKALDQLPPAPSQDNETPKRRTFIIRETECLKSETADPSQCDYKTDGVESHDSENITFIIKETACLKSGAKDKKCSFKEDGIVKNCTASPPGPDRRRLEVRCQTVDTSDVSEDKKPEATRNHRVYKPLTGKQGINFLQFDNRRSQTGHSAATCVTCIFDWLNTNTNGR